MDLDVDTPINIMEEDFKDNVKGITSRKIMKKICNSNPIKKFTFRLRLEDSQINMARFMMEGLGFHAKYFICTGLETLEILMSYNLADKRYEDLLPIPGRRDVLCLKGLPLFYENVENFGDVLLLVSDINTEMRYTPVCSFVSEFYKEKYIDKDFNDNTRRVGGASNIHKVWAEYHPTGSPAGIWGGSTSEGATAGTPTNIWGEPTSEGTNSGMDEDIPF